MDEYNDIPWDDDDADKRFAELPDHEDLEDLPDDGLIGLAFAYERAGDLEGARLAHELELRRHAHEPWALYFLAAAEFYQQALGDEPGAPERARELFARVLDPDVSGNPGDHIEALQGLAALAGSEEESAAYAARAAAIKQESLALSLAKAFSLEPEEAAALEAAGYRCLQDIQLLSSEELKALPVLGDYEPWLVDLVLDLNGLPDREWARVEAGLYDDEDWDDDEEAD